MISVLVGGQVDGASLGIPAQGGDTRFLQRFALRLNAFYDPATSMRFSLEDQNPLIVGAVTGGAGYPETTYSLLQPSDPSVMLWALKPAEDGMSNGVVTRFWNMSSRNTSFTFKLQGGIRSASAITHLETEPARVPVTSAGVQAEMKPLQLRSFALQPGAPAPAARAKQSKRR